MEFFGVTLYGFPNPIKDLIRADYQEPQKVEDLAKLPPYHMDKIKSVSYSESIKKLDCYLGHADGFAYKSYDRLHHSKKKHVTKPFGPCDMYKYSGTDSMNIGWWLEDPELAAKIQTNWHKPNKSYPVLMSEMSRHLNHCLQVDKFFRM